MMHSPTRDGTPEGTQEVDEEESKGEDTWQDDMTLPSFWSGTSGSASVAEAVEDRSSSSGGASDVNYDLASSTISGNSPASRLGALTGTPLSVSVAASTGLWALSTSDVADDNAVRLWDLRDW